MRKRSAIICSLATILLHMNIGDAQPLQVMAADGADQKGAAANCKYDSSAMLALSEEKFDQEPHSGWRDLADRNGCQRAAADLISAYMTAHVHVSELLSWHRGQLLAFSGDSKGAIAAMLKSFKSPESDVAGWNLYVNATISFLRHDRKQFEKFRMALSKLPPAPGLPKPENGFITLKSQSGTDMKMAWPMNMDVVNGLEQCFNKTYTIAYDGVCRSPGSSRSNP